MFVHNVALWRRVLQAIREGCALCPADRFALTDVKNMGEFSGMSMLTLIRASTRVLQLIGYTTAIKAVS